MFVFSFQDGSSALMLASRDGHTEIVKYIIEAKALLDLQEKVYCAYYDAMLCITSSFDMLPRMLLYICHQECSFVET